MQGTYISVQRLFSCGADVDEMLPDPEVQILVDQFIEGHARINGTPLHVDSAEGVTGESKDQSIMMYEDTSSAGGSFLAQQAMQLGFLCQLGLHYDEQEEMQMAFAIVSRWVS